MNPLSSSKCLFLGYLFVVSVTAIDGHPPDHKFTFPVEGFAPRNKTDHVIINIAKFAFDEHSKQASKNSTLRPWKYEEVYKAMSKDISHDAKKIAILAWGLDGPLYEICEAMVEVNNNIPNLIAFHEPKFD
ncbi:hypothetical protein LIER_31772 [Lithospermum erythrorhizon]|uniref:Uncharacterized protein n=1 Tax=Lithospermum erythrorhizon TaxID=34254 RepID=A0AAV3RU60_LITER